jgi:hypothetical protein
MSISLVKITTTIKIITTIYPGNGCYLHGQFTCKNNSKSDIL